MTDHSMTPISNAMLSAFERIEGRALNLVLPGTISGFYDLDVCTQGFAPGDLVVLCGATSVGKSALAYNIARNVTELAGLPVGLFNLETTDERITERLISNRTGIDLNRIHSGRLHQVEWEPIGKAISEIERLPLFINSDPLITVEQIVERTEELQAKHSNLGLIIVDNLHLMQVKPGEDVVQLSHIVRRLKAMALNLKVPVLLLAQINRDSRRRLNQRPLIGDLRQSGVIEEIADIVLGLFREEQVNPLTPNRGIAELIILKQRNGTADITIPLLFDSRCVNFRNCSIPLSQIS